MQPEIIFSCTMEKLARNRDYFGRTLKPCYEESSWKHLQNFLTIHYYVFHSVCYYLILCQRRLVFVGKASLNQRCQCFGPPLSHPGVWVLADLQDIIHKCTVTIVKPKLCQAVTPLTRNGCGDHNTTNWETGILLVSTGRYK